MRSPIRTAALIGKFGSTDVAQSLAALAEWFGTHDVAVSVETATADACGALLAAYAKADYETIAREADVAIVVGGDGTMLNAARRLADSGVPLVGVNQGRLGFMTDVARETLLQSMADLLAGRFHAEQRFLLEATLERGGEVRSTNLALNEVTLSKGGAGRMIEFELHVDGEFIYVLRADGMILATPTGSTAYALSANGPILHPGVDGIAVVPLYPHGLSYRPITISAASRIELKLVEPHDALLHFDGQDHLEVTADDRVRVHRAACTIVFLHPPGYSYFAMLREKLHWSATPKRV